MTEKVEWEVVDDPSAKQQQHQQQYQQQFGRRTPGDAMRMMLGRGWKWKIAGTAIVSLVTLAFFATLTGALVLLFAAGTLLAAGVRKFKQWLTGERRETSLRV
ncbi:hypothetical protein [Noviherbaspirillum denitrificans]|uniref:Uncharacterized protein n=1 Tax=Noviherbaspirillum denitrificans TaxID=1968433 RepID=A0A254THF9_9BURK|nr:hypothetical protein [Noviherbaspirillum denitrificans]OWW22080.1 hypothetical protein AYR66_23890 [Noviherbaspirillum denitrificans]